MTSPAAGSGTSPGTDKVTPPELAGHVTANRLRAACSSILPRDVRSVGSDKYMPELFVSRGVLPQIQTFVDSEKIALSEQEALFTGLRRIAANHALGADVENVLRAAQATIRSEQAQPFLANAINRVKESLRFREVQTIERMVDYATRASGKRAAVLRANELTSLCSNLPWMTREKLEEINNAVQRAAQFGVASTGEYQVHFRNMILENLLAYRDSENRVILANDLIRRLDWLVRGLSRQCLALVGRAGHGKTTLLCSLAERVSETQPIILLSGEMTISNEYDVLHHVRRRLEEADPGDWSNWIDQTTRALRSDGGWLIIIIDGINESANLGLLARALADLLNRCEGKRVKLIVSCRDIFWEIFASRLEPYLFEEKPVIIGQFSDAESREALKLYCDKYDVTLQIDERVTKPLHHPLLLRFFCEAHRGERLDVMVEPELCETFERYVSRSTRAAATRLDRVGASALLTFLLDVGETMWRNRSTSLTPRHLCLSPEDVDMATSAYNLLRSESLIFESGTAEDPARHTIRFLYDEFMEYVIARAWSARISMSPRREEALDALLTEAVESFQGFLPAWGALLFLDRIERSGGKIINRLLEVSARLGEGFMNTHQAALLAAFAGMSSHHLDEGVLACLDRFEHRATGDIKTALSPVLLRAIECRPGDAAVKRIWTRILELDLDEQERAVPPHVRSGQGATAGFSHGHKNSVNSDADARLLPVRHHYSRDMRLKTIALIASSGAADVAIVEQATRRLGVLDLHSALEVVKALEHSRDDVVLPLVERYLSMRPPEYAVYCARLLRDRYGLRPAQLFIALLTDERTRVHRHAFRQFQTRRVEPELVSAIVERLEGTSSLKSWHLVSLIRLLDPARATREPPLETRNRAVAVLDVFRRHPRAAIRVEAVQVLVRYADLVNLEKLVLELAHEEDPYLASLAAELESKSD